MINNLSTKNILILAILGALIGYINVMCINKFSDKIPTNNEIVSHNEIVSDNEIVSHNGIISNNIISSDKPDNKLQESFTNTETTNTSSNSINTEITEAMVSDNAVSDNAVSENAVSDNAVSENVILDNKNPENTVKENANFNIYINKYNNIVNQDLVLPENPTYSIRVNKTLNTVTVYLVEGENEIPYMAMLCSCGRAGHGTPSGTFKTSESYEWRLMVDGTYGKYAVRFNNKILFHSVPYFETKNDSLEWDQFNLLGENASLGCVRMAVNDVKWIYDNCEYGTKVVVYEDETTPGPLGKPEGIKLLPNSIYKDWDPTDPDENNPWHEYYN